MPFEVEFLPVGTSSGDAIVLRYGSDAAGYTVHVIDGGYADTGQVIINHLEQHYGPNPRIEHVTLSHADQDHASGLRTILAECNVGTLWMNRPWLYASEVIHNFHGNYTVQGLTKAIRDAYPLLVELETIAAERGITIRDAFAGTWIGQLRVASPSRERYLELIPELDGTPTSYAEAASGGFMKALQQALAKAQQWFESWWDEKLSENPDPTSASNESSVVHLAHLDGQQVLLTADAGPQALSDAADFAEAYGILQTTDLFQIPHHGSRRNVTPTVLNRWLGGPVPQGTPYKGYAVCSVGTNKLEYPRKRVQNAVLRRGYHVSTTRAGYIRYASGIYRAGLGPIESEPFVTSYEE